MMGSFVCAWAMPLTQALPRRGVGLAERNAPRAAYGCRGRRAHGDATVWETERVPGLAQWSGVRAWARRYSGPPGQAQAWDEYAYRLQTDKWPGRRAGWQAGQAGAGSVRTRVKNAAVST